MRIAFLDFTPWNYQTSSPWEMPLGGSQSAICYLAEALALKDHGITLFNGVKMPIISRGVTCRPLARMTHKDLNGFDAVIIQNVTQPAVNIRQHLRGGVPLILWTQHAHDQPAMQLLAQPEIRNSFDGFAFVSEWQRDCFVQSFQIALDKSAVMRNAAGPAFWQLLPAGQPIMPQKTRPPVLAYSSTPFRGLDVLIELFPRIRAAVPTVTLRIFSSMQVYQVAAEHDQARHGKLYAQCQSTAGVEYVGSLPQPALAQRMRGVTALAYPNHFAETSCIAVLEAMAAGCQVITSQLGALPETCAGFARLIPRDQTATAYADQFVSETVNMLLALDNPAKAAETESRLQAQTAQIRTTCTWTHRAQEWQSWLKRLTQPASRAPCAAQTLKTEN